MSHIKVRTENISHCDCKNIDHVRSHERNWNWARLVLGTEYCTLCRPVFMIDLCSSGIVYYTIAI